MNGCSDIIVDVSGCGQQVQLTKLVAAAAMLLCKLLEQDDFECTRGWQCLQLLHCKELSYSSQCN